jgi:hypothetical protein
MKLALLEQLKNSGGDPAVNNVGCLYRDYGSAD